MKHEPTQLRYAAPESVSARVTKGADLAEPATNGLTTANCDLARSGRRTPADEAETAHRSAIEAAFDAIGQGFMLLDEQSRVTDFNSRLNDIVGFAPGVLRVGASVYDLVRSLSALGHFRGFSFEEACEGWRRHLADGAPGDYLDRRLDGRTIMITYAPFGGGGWVVTFEDISARVDAEEALARQNERLDAALTNMPHGLCMFDARKRLIMCNAAYSKLYTLPPELTVAGTPLQRILETLASVGRGPTATPAYLDVVDNAMALATASVRKVLLQDGRTIRITHNPMSDGGYVATHEDITEAVRAAEKIRYLGSHDGLTGLPNRFRLRDRIEEALPRIGRGGMLAIHYLDLDNFKSVNDTHGHTIGDLLLKRATERLQQGLRKTDTLARFGGDEFVLLQTDIESPEQAASLSRRLVEAMAEPFDLEGRLVYLGVSVGVSVCPGDGTDVDTLLRNADLAMYRSKSDGRNTYRFFEFTMDARLQQRRLLELDIRRAVANGEFELYYQPQVDARTESITGCEALLRWNHPSRGTVAPNEFIPVAEESGMIVPLGTWVIEQACRDAATWPNDIAVAVNLSPVQFKGLALVQTVISALEAAGLSPLRLELEITESTLLANSEATIATLNHLRALGVRIAMDDFGTGYSSLSYLRSFPFDKIKIDRSFIKDLGEKNDCAAIVRAMADLGAALGMTITAEGVETVEQLGLVRDLGCVEAQGFLFGRPSTAQALLAMLRLKDAAGRRSPRGAQGRVRSSGASTMAKPLANRNRAPR